MSRACTESDRLCVVPLLGELVQAVDQAGNLHQIMTAAVNLIVRQIAGAERVVLCIIQEKSSELIVENAWGLSEEERKRGHYKLGEGISGKVALSGSAVVVPDMSKESEFLDRTESRKFKDKSQLAFICVPIKLGKITIGTLSVDVPSTNGWELGREKRLLSVVACMIAQAVHVHRLKNKHKKIVFPMDQTFLFSEQTRDVEYQKLKSASCLSLKDRLADFEKKLIWAALVDHKGNMSAAAKELQISSRIMALRVKEYGFDYKAIKRFTESCSE